MDESVNVWEQFCWKATDSPFLMGQNDRGWMLNIDWALRPNSITSVFEGKYEKVKSIEGNRNGRTKTDRLYDATAEALADITG